MLTEFDRRMKEQETQGDKQENKADNNLSDAVFNFYTGRFWDRDDGCKHAGKWLRIPKTGRRTPEKYNNK